MLKLKNSLIYGSPIGLPSWAAIFVLICFVTGVQAQNKCDTELAEAERYYNSAESDSVIKWVSTCLNKDGLGEGELVRAYRLLSLAYIAKDSTHRAENAIEKLLKAVPNYAPDREDNPEYLDLVEKMKKKLPPAQSVVAAQPKKKGGKKWLWIGLGTAALGGGAVAVLAGGGKGGGPPTLQGNQKLPDPPGSP